MNESVSVGCLYATPWHTDEPQNVMTKNFVVFLFSKKMRVSILRDSAIFGSFVFWVWHNRILFPIHFAFIIIILLWDFCCCCWVPTASLIYAASEDVHCVCLRLCSASGGSLFRPFSVARRIRKGQLFVFRSVKWTSVATHALSSANRCPGIFPFNTRWKSIHWKNFPLRRICDNNKKKKKEEILVFSGDNNDFAHRILAHFHRTYKPTIFHHTSIHIKIIYSTRIICRKKRSERAIDEHE